MKGWLKTPHQNTKKDVPDTIGVSVVVAVRNESKSMRKCVESILNQKYAQDLVEVFVVDDFSTDDTLNILKEYENRIQLIELKNILPADRAHHANKKQAISYAVEQAKFPLILCGDGDCIYGELWIKSMMQYYGKYAKRFISGPVDYFESNTWWSKFLTMDLVSMIGVTAGSIGQKRPVMASGANMLFEKAVFKEVNGYQGNDHVASGDDVFLMQKIFLRDDKAIGFVKNRKAFAFTHPPESFKEFLNQRIRWTSKSGQLADKQVKGVLILNYLFYLICFISLFVLPWFNWVYLFLGLIVLGLKILIDVLFFKNILAFYNKSHLLKLIFPIELLHIVYVSLMGVLAIFGQYSWKGRQIKK